MDYYTSGRAYYRDFKLPLVYYRSAAIPSTTEAYYGLLYADRGFVTIDDGTEKRLIKAPSVVFIRPSHGFKTISVSEGNAHSLIFRPQAVNTTAPNLSEGGDEMRNYFFYRPFVDTRFPDHSAKALRPELVPIIDGLFARIDANLNVSQSEFWPCISRSYFLELLILLERNWYDAPNIEEFSDGREAGMVARVREFLHANYAEPITLDGLSARFATNRTTLNRRFNEACEMSAMAYLNAVRIEIAASLLRNTELKVAEIAQRTGFSDESYFSRAFKKKNGESPAAYRKSYPNPYS